MDITGAMWRKSTRSGSNGGGCVEVATTLDGVVAVRDSKQPQGSVLAFPSAEFRTFVEDTKNGRFYQGT